MKILLAEDDMNISTIAKLSLESMGGHIVTVVHDGKSALLEAKKGGYDLILLDEMMPKLNGLSVCQEFKNFDQNNIPVIFLSAKSQDDDIKEFNKWGLGYISKPFDPTTICSEIKNILLKLSHKDQSE